MWWGAGNTVTVGGSERKDNGGGGHQCTGRSGILRIVVNGVKKVIVLAAVVLRVRMLWWCLGSVVVRMTWSW